MKDPILEDLEAEKNIIVKPYNDKELPMSERRADFAERVNKHLNPLLKKDFNADTFECNGEDMRLVGNRQRIDLPDRLPTYGLKAKQIREGQMIGMYESKQDLYLISAQIYNKLQDKIDDLQNQINNINNKINK